MNIICKKLRKNIYHLIFPGRFSLCSTFCRFQEYYESPEFSNKIFTMREFRNWYKKSKNINVYTYNHDWNGFNIPSSVLKPFFEGNFNPLSSKERQLLDVFNHKKGKFYIIGTWSDNSNYNNDVLQHEIAHAFWFLSPSYRQTAQKIISKMDRHLYNCLKDILSNYGYANHVIDDEINAYFATCQETKKKIFDGYNIMLKDVSKEVNELRNLFNKFRS